jgi:Na+-driven multidrug efflux pump
MNFTQGKILGPLLRFSIPVFLAMLLQAMYGAVDLAVVGQFGDKAGVSAVSTGSLVMVTVTGLVRGLTMGLTILLAQKIGERNDRDAADAVGASILLFSAAGALLTLITLLASRPLTSVMQAPPEAYDDTLRYIRICSLGCLVITAYNAISAVFRGMGNSKAPLLFVAIACAVNIAGDLLLVGVFGLVRGRSRVRDRFLAGGQRRVFRVAYPKEGLSVPLRTREYPFPPPYCRGLLKFGSPIALQDALTNVSFMAVIAS